MDIDDSIMEIVQRSKARKDFLKMKTENQISAGKRRAPLVEDTQLQEDEGVEEDIPKESPKRQCLLTTDSESNENTKENLVSEQSGPRSPFVPVHTNLKGKGLAALRRQPLQKNESNNPEPMDVQESEEKQSLSSVEKPIVKPIQSSSECKKIAEKKEIAYNLEKKNIGDHIKDNDQDKDPAELSLSARRALFEKAFLGEKTKQVDSVIHSKLSVAERAALFEKKRNQEAKPKINRLPNLLPPSPAKSNMVPSPVSSPAKCLSPAKASRPDIVKGSPSRPLCSTPMMSPSKNVGAHTQLIQQKLMESADSTWQQKDMIVKATEERKKEISNLVNRWEKASSLSSVENDPSETEPEAAETTAEEYDQFSEEEEEVNESEEEFEKEETVSSQQSSIHNSSELEVDLPVQKYNVREETEKAMLQTEPSFVKTETQSVSSNGSGYVSVSQGSRSSSSSSTELYPSPPKADTPLLHTISFYRKQKQDVRLSPVRTIVRREKVLSPPSPDNTQFIQERIKVLQDEILKEQCIISQTSQALNLCHATAEFLGSTEQVEGERLLLVATQKRQAYLNEIQRLKVHGAEGEAIPEGTGTLTISDLQLPLKPAFMAMQLEARNNDAVHYFLCLIRHGAQVIVTHMVSTQENISEGKLHFTNHIKLQNLPAEFAIVFEVYALQTKKEVLPHEKKYHIKRDSSKTWLTPKGKRSDAKILFPSISSPGGPNAVRSPSFGVVGYTRFMLQNCNKSCFTLNEVPFASPLEGILKVKIRLHAEHKVSERGFLTMFEDVSGFGAWHRRWCILDASCLEFWKYPDDEKKKDPIGTIELGQCITSQVRQVSRDVCARPHTFQLLTVRPQEKGDKNTLISRSVNTLTTTKHLISADTKEERVLWCNKLNEALTNIRKWDPQALRPVQDK